MENLEIRMCNYSSKNDLDAVVDLVNIYIRDNMGGGAPINGLKKLKLIDGLNTHPSSIVLLAVHNDSYVGLAICFETFATFSVKKCINIHDLIVPPEYRELGIGKKLMKKIMEIAEERDCSKVTLEVREDNYKAQMLYNSYGFGECNPPMKFWVKHINQ